MFYTYPYKSSVCPYCTPRCPHGYPADTQPYQPKIMWQIPVTAGITVSPDGKYQFTFTGFEPNAQK